MKTNEVKACVTQQLRRLQVLPEPQRRAELAELRRGVGRQPGDLPALWGALLADMPEQLQGSNGPSKAEWAVYTALTLFALHQQGEAGVSMNQPGRTLGGAVRQLAEKWLPGRTGPRAACSGGSTHWQRRIPCRKSRTTCAG